MATSFDEDNGDVVLESSVNKHMPDTLFQPFTKAERIRQLNEIDQSIMQLLKSAGLAIKTLTTSKSDPNTDGEFLEDRPHSFTDATNSYLKVLHSVDLRLKRQIFGLGEAGIVGMDKEPTASSGDKGQEAPRASIDKVTLDVGWLNSRSGKVGRDMEAELWRKARSFLETLASEESSGQSNVDVDINEDAEMRDG